MNSKTDRTFFIVSYVIAMTILVAGIFVIRERYSKIHFVPQNIRAIAH